MNMYYCKFENTLIDLRDCYNAMDEDLGSGNEIKARHELIKLCVDIVTDYEYELEKNSEGE